MTERFSLYFALLVAWIATLGSLYFSEVLHYIPCTLCWYQRILMYPMALILPIGLLRRDHHLPYYTLLLSFLGMGMSTYHYLLQKTTWFTSAGVCTSSVPCNLDYINWLGFITIPFLALIAFTLIFFASLVVTTSRTPVWDEEEPAPWRPVLAILALAFLVFVPGFLRSRGNDAATTESNQSLIEGNAAGQLTPSTTDGRAIYLSACAACHGPQAQGISGLGTSLAAATSTHTLSDEAWIALVRQGIPADDPNNQTGVPMPPSGGRTDLIDADLQAILDYLRTLQG